MTWRTLLTVLRKSWLRRAQDERDLDDEIQFHLAREAELLSERGAPRDTARWAAKRAFGNVSLAKETMRGVWISTAVEQLVHDLRIGCRIFSTAPGMSAAAVVLIVLVIGGNTTVFSIAHGILTKPAPGVTAPRLVTLSWIDEKGWVDPFNSYAAYDAFQESATTLESLLGWDMDRATLSHDDGSYALHRAFVTPSYFETLGVRFEKGRSFTKSEADSGAFGTLAIISHHAWQSYFHGAEDIVGKPVMLNNQPATIIGVVTGPFRGMLLVPPADLWVPLSAVAATQSAGRPFGNRSDMGVGITGRLAPGVSREQAHAELSAIWSRLQTADPRLNQKVKLVLAPYSVTAGGNSLVSQNGGTFLAIFSVVTLMTLLIVCANVANLLVARAVVRQRELSLRQSLGASRVRIVRALLAEGLALSVAAWIAACLFAWWISKSIGGFLTPTTQGMAAMPDFTPDWTVIGYALVLAIVCTVICTVAPAIRACRQELVPSLKAGEQAIVRGRSKLTGGLVVLQLAFSVLLVTSAGLAYRSLFRIGEFDAGFDTRDLLLVTVNTAGSAADRSQNAALLERLSASVAEVPGVAQVAYARGAPREFSGTAPVGLPDGSSTGIRAESTRVGPHYLRLLGVTPVVGRDLGPEDRFRSTRSALISRNLAEKLWPGQSPLGRTLLFERQEVEVVGVAPNIFFSGFRREHPGMVLLSAQQDPFQPGEATLYVKCAGDLDGVSAAITRQLRRTNAQTPIASMRTWDAQIDSTTFPIRVLTTLLMLFAGVSLFIAAIGQYAAVSFDMRRRTRELGLRIALGASARQVMASALRDGFTLTAVGLVIGLAMSLAAAAILGGALYGVSATDPLTYIAVSALLSAASLIACYLPAHRASRINPMTALRVE